MTESSHQAAHQDQFHECDQQCEDGITVDRLIHMLTVARRRNVGVSINGSIVPIAGVHFSRNSEIISIDLHMGSELSNALHPEATAWRDGKHFFVSNACLHASRQDPWDAESAALADVLHGACQGSVCSMCRARCVCDCHGADQS